MIYQLRGYFLFPDHEESHSMLFQSEGDEQAVLAAWKWVRNRQRAAPGVFTDLGCLKVDQYHIGVPQPDGYINTGAAIFGYEWKCDTGGPPLIP